MGIVIPFRPRQTTVQPPPAALSYAGGIDPDQVVMKTLFDGGDRYDILEAAADLLAVCRDRYGFTVMQSGLPHEPEALADALVALLRGLVLLDPEFAGCRPIPGFGVYFGGAQLEWFEDGSGGRTGFSVPIGVNAVDIATFMRPRIRRMRRS